MTHNQNRPYEDLTQLNRPGKFNVTIRDKSEHNEYADRPQSSGASASCSWFISNDTHNVRIGTDIGDHEIGSGQDGEQYKNAIHVVGAYNSNITCSNRNCGSRLNDATVVERGNKILSYVRLPDLSFL